VAIPNADRTPSGVIISGYLNTLSPGSVLIHPDPDAETWTIHALDVSDPQAVIENAQEFYERYQRPVWP
jgi:multisubunit Na+/H+ antiporter MnhE subunit